ncbi:MAG: mechanosensitive ion channel domain-containing protein, partial [Hyphomicrobiales bacterium]
MGRSHRGGVGVAAGLWLALAALAVGTHGAVAGPAGGTAAAARESVATGRPGADRAVPAAAESLAVPESTAAAAETPSPSVPSEAPPPVAPSEPIYLGGGILFEIRNPLGNPDLETRAATIRRRLQHAVAARETPSDSVSVEATPYGARILFARSLLFNITPRDLGAGDTRTALAAAQDLIPAITAGIDRERAQLAPGRLLVSAALSALLTLLYILLIRIFLRGGHRVGQSLGGRVGGLVGRIRVRGTELIPPLRTTRLFQNVVMVLAVAALLVLGYAYLSIVFSFFPWTQGWSNRLIQFAVEGIRSALVAVAHAVPNLVLAVAIVYVARLVIRFLSKFLDLVGAGTIALPGLHPELAKPTKQLVRVFLWIAVLIIVYPLIPGSQSPAFRGVSILLGVVVSFGSTGLVENLLAGMVLTYARSYRIGERIGTGDVLGDVIGFGLLTTKIRTIKNEEITLGNGQILKGSVRNYSRRATEGEGLILHTSVTIGYDAPWRRVHELLIEAAEATEGIEKEPKPFVLQRALSDFYVEYEINATTREASRMAVLYGLLHQNIQDAFNRAGVEIMSPH